jgi:hypothetical protein
MEPIVTFVWCMAILGLLLGAGFSQTSSPGAARRLKELFEKHESSVYEVFEKVSDSGSSSLLDIAVAMAESMFMHQIGVSPCS